MPKAGESHVAAYAILVAVAAVALLGIYYSTSGVGKATAFDSCQQYCYDNFAHPDQLSACLGGCVTQTSVPLRETYAPEPTGRITGLFAVPSAKAYGGAVRGVADPSSRAFAGRAMATDRLSCFTCSCGNEYTVDNKEAAQNACTNSCDGTITNEKAGSC